MDDPEKAQALPSYAQVQQAGPAQTSTNPDDLRPDYSFPKTFRVGLRSTRPFVTSEQLKSHLALLRSFYGLRQRAEITEFTQVSPSPPETLKERRWAFFVGYAVERFQIWCYSPMLKMDDTVPVPPDDVLMVWHAYRLNPGWYAEDALRIRAVTRLEEKAGAMFGKLIGGSTVASHSLNWAGDFKSPQVPDNEWVRLTETPFDAFEGIRNWTHRLHVCPFCGYESSAELLKSDGTGYLQHSFQHKCVSCGESSSHEVAAVKKFALDFTWSGGGNFRNILAGTLHTPDDPCDIERARAVRLIIGTSNSLSRPADCTTYRWTRHIGQQCKWSKVVLSRKVGQKMLKGGPRAVSRMMSAYIDDRPFSVDLVGAVLRQASFVEKMHKLRWTEPDYFSSAEDEIALQHCIARYHAFLDLLSSTPTSFFVPTLDIDLAWHTHQLFSSDYGKDTRKYVGRFIDHDDKIEEDTLANGFDITCRAWEARFNVQYSLCGCPMPGETIGQKLSMRASRLFQDKAKHAPSHLLPPKREDLLAGTHPSDHNGVVVFAHRSVSDAKRKKRKEKQLRRQAKAAERRKDDKYYMGADPFWGAPFIYPVPIYYYGAACSAVPGVVYAGCSSGGCTGGGGCGGSGGCGGGCGGGGGGCGGGGCGGS